MHSEDWQSADPWKGKKCIVIGTANTGKTGSSQLTLSQFMANNDSLVMKGTMLQRICFLPACLQSLWFNEERRVSNRMARCANRHLDQPQFLDSCTAAGLPHYFLRLYVYCDPRSAPIILTGPFAAVWPPGRDSEISDRYFWSPPTAVVRLATMNHVWSMIDSEP